MQERFEAAEVARAAGVPGAAGVVGAARAAGAAGERPWADGGRVAGLYAEHAPAALRFAYLLTGDRALAQDLVQEAFVRLGGRLAQVRDPSAFGAYLRRTVLNLMRMHVRHRRVEEAYLTREGAMRMGAVHAEPDVAAREAMRQALLSLPPRQRTAIVLRFYEDLPERRIGEILGCAQGTVASLVWRGLRALRGEVEEPGEDGWDD